MTKKNAMPDFGTPHRAILRESVNDMMAFDANTSLLDGRFVIKRRLGSGGMGIVYEAIDNIHDNRVALKVLSEVSPSGIYRLKQEFRSLSGVTHPNLVVLHELFAHENVWFFTMDLVFGQPLQAYLNDDYELSRLKQVFLDLAAGINAIHDAGKLHRDLKPNNVLVTPEGTVRILDFGLVSDEAEGGVGQTVLDECASGTPLYMAPEQTAAKPSVRATDWYAFGVMLFEALTGQLPFDGTTREVFDRKQREIPPRPKELLPGIPDDLDELCWALLRRSPEKRPGYDRITTILGRALSSPLRSSVEATPFIGRKNELVMLERALDATDGGAPVTVFIDGSSGIGKSTLIDHFLERVRNDRGAVVLKGRCYERESVPFKACDSLIDDLTHYLRKLPKPLAARLMPRRVTALARIFPVLNRLEVVRETRERFKLPVNPSELRRCAFQAAKELLARISAQERLIIYVDDLQWSDVDGMKMLTSLISPTDGPSVLLIGAFRREDARDSAGLTLLKERIANMKACDIRRIHLDPFTDEEAVQLAQRVLPKQMSALAGQIAKEAHGSPFLISELSTFAGKSPADDEATRLNQVVGERLKELSDDAKSLLISIAVTGRPVELPLLRCALDKTNIFGALQSLETLKLIRHTGGVPNKVACYHDRIRETVLALIDEETSRLYHGKLADALETEKNPDPIMMTEHLLGADRKENLAGYALKAAQLAEESLAFENAARFYDIALSSTPLSKKHRWEIERELAEALAHAGRGPEAATIYIRAAESAPVENALSLRCQAAQQWINSGHMIKGKAELDQVLRTVGLKLCETPRRATWFLIRNRIGLRWVFPRIGNKPKHPPTSRQLLEIRASEAAVFGLWATDTLQAAAFCSHYLKRAIQVGMPNEIVKGLCSEAAFRVTEKLGDSAAIKRFMNTAEEMSQSITDTQTLAHLKLAHGMAAFTRIDLPETIRLLEKTERFCLEECTRKMATLEMSQVFLGAAYCRLGRWSALQRAWDRWIAYAKETGNLHHLAVCRMWLMGTFRWLAADRPDIAQDQLERGERDWAFAEFNMQRSQAMISRAYILYYQGSDEHAYELFSEVMTQVFSSYMKHMKFARTFYTIDYACCALALASSLENNEKPLKVAKQLIGRLRKEHTSYTKPYIAYFQAVLAHLEGREDECASYLKQAAAQFEASRFHLHAAAVKRRLGCHLGGMEGEALRDAGTQTMTDEKIVNPARVTRILAPGFVE